MDLAIDAKYRIEANFEKPLCYLCQDRIVINHKEHNRLRHFISKLTFNTNEIGNLLESPFISKNDGFG